MVRGVGVLIAIIRCVASVFVREHARRRFLRGHVFDCALIVEYNCDLLCGTFD